jgi:DNA-binding beta-propeller fold protein YncE
MKRFLWLACALFVYLICSGCGDTFRPIIIPNPPTFPDPRAAHTVVSINDDEINDNGTIVPLPGSAMVIDVSGDAAVSVADVGLAPVYAVQQSASQVLVVNQAVTDLNVPTTTCLVTVPPTPPNHVFNVCSSITKLNFSGTVIVSASSITLPIYSGANFVAAAPTDTLAYVTLPTFPPDPSQPLTVVPSVGVVNIQSNNLFAPPTPVGKNPVAIAVTPDKSKLYVANQGDGTISAFNTNAGNLSARTINGTFNAPVWVSARSDSQRVYVLGNGVVSTVDTHTTAGPDSVIDASISAPLATYMLYDGHLNRLYIPGGDQLTVLDVSAATPLALQGSPIAIPTVLPSSRNPTDPCSSTTAQTALTVAAVAALPDGSRAYVGAYYRDSLDNICPQVAVIDATSNTVKSFFGVPGFPDATNSSNAPYYAPACATARFRMTMAAAGDSFRAYLASCDGGNINIIDTSNDTYIESQQAPVGSRPPIPPSSLNPPQNPVFLFAGP